MEERPFTIRDIEGQDVVIPGDFVELYDKTSGIKSLTLRGWMLKDLFLHLGEMIYENVATGERWFTALDPESRLYFYSIDPDTLETRSEWSLPVPPVSAEGRDKVGIMTLHCQSYSSGPNPSQSIQS